MNWGIIGYGEITPSFIVGLQAVSKSKLIGIASISSFEYLQKNKFYQKVQIFSNYEELAKHPEIDIIYVATTNNLHYENAKLVLNNNKHLLIEKPFTPTAKQTQELISLARKKNLFVMEGMWTRFLPSYRKFISMLNDGIIGKPKLLKVDFGFLNNWSKHRRLLNPNLFGGTLLDNADYNIFLSQDVFSEYPSAINAQATFASTGVEDACSILMKYPSGGMAQLYSSFRCETKQEAIIYGDKGYIELKEFWHGTKIVLSIDSKVEVFEFPHKANGFEYQIEAVEKSINENKIECDILPHLESKQVAMIIDEVKILIKK